MKREIWKPVLGYIGLYEVSNYGRVRSLNYNHTGKIKILKLDKKKNGYLCAHLSKNGRTKNFLVHRLVWEAFNGKIPEDMQVNHINEIKTDNSLWNLNLMSCKENINWGTGIQRMKEKRSDSVLQLTPDGQLVKEWSSMNEAGRHGYRASAVCRCCRGKLKQYKGFLWVKKSPLCQWYNYTNSDLSSKTLACHIITHASI